MDELDYVFTKRSMADATKTTHIQTLKKIQSIFDIGKPLHKFPINVIKIIINNKSITPSYRAKILSLFIVIKNTYDENDSDLPKLRELLHEASNDKLSKRVEDFKTEDVDLYNDIETYINSIDITKYPIRFIVNYIIFYLNTRNMDLVCKVVDMDTTTVSDTNYLILYPDRVIFIRPNYKTAKSYDTKVNEITDPRFVHAVSLLPKNEYLLTDNPKNIGNMVSRQLYKNNNKHMTETTYLHNVINHYKHDVNKLLEIEHNRGTDLRTLLTNYNSFFKNEK
jgi:hypothetical protein